MPASSQLPDEIIKEILAPALYVSNEAFANTSGRGNPFARYSLSTSTILVVCKSWLRVATPLLYETVVLRSKAQAQSLAGVLKRNPHFGQFIRKLRVEGGYGAFVGEILRCSPLLTDLLISTILYSSESVGGYLKGFQSINPRRLIVVDDHLPSSAIRKKVYEALTEAIGHSWLNLVSLEINLGTRDLDRIEPFIATLLEASRLEYLTFHPGCVVPDPVLRLAKIPSLKQIRVIGTRWAKPPRKMLQIAPRCSQLEMLMRDDQSLYDKVVYVSARKDGRFDFNIRVLPPDDGDESLPKAQTSGVQNADGILHPPLDPNWRPLAGASEQARRDIFSSILRHAASLSMPGMCLLGHRRTFLSLQRFRAGLTLVSRQFNELATPYLYESTTVNPAGLQSLSHSPHTNHIKFLWLQIPDTARTSAEFMRSLYALLTRCHGLVLVSEVNSLHNIARNGQRADPLPYQWSRVESDMILRHDALIVLANNCPGTLQHLHLNTGLPSFKSQNEFAEVLNAMGRLRELRSLTMCGKFQSIGDLTGVDVSAGRFHPDAFPHLERLFVGPNCTLNKVFLHALCSATLPALTWLRIIDDALQPEPDPSIEKFLSVHGSKLTYLQSNANLGGLFTYCTNVIRWHATCIDADDWDPEHDFRCLDADNLDPDLDVAYALTRVGIPHHSFSPFGAVGLLDRDLSRLSNLKEIHILGCFEWPKSQHEIERSAWVKVAEAMVERWNVKLVDGHGISWVPRLKPSRK